MFIAGVIPGVAETCGKAFGRDLEIPRTLDSIIAGGHCFKPLSDERKSALAELRWRVRLAPKDTALQLLPGGLSLALSSLQKSTITSLKITGSIDARDFKIMRDSMELLSAIDLSGATIAGYTGREGTAGDSVVHYPPGEIPRKAFYGKYLLSLFVFPPSTTSIGESSFYNCQNFKGQLLIPGAVRYIRDSAFEGCWSLDGNLEIPGSVLEIGDFAFNYCSGLTGLEIPGSVVHIGKGAFLACKYLAGVVVLPASLDVIEEYSFARCGHLEQVVIPNSVKHIGSYAFTMAGLTTVDLPGSLVAIGAAAFAFCGLTNLVIPNSVDSIAGDAFYSNNLGSITIPPSVSYIGSRAFYLNCHATSVYALSPVPVELSSSPDVFYCMDSTTLHVPAGSVALYRAAGQWKEFPRIVGLDATGQAGVSTPVGVSIFPNPATRGFYLASAAGQAVVSVFSLSGRQLLRKDVAGDGFIPVAALPEGMYIVRVVTPERTFECKFVKK